MPIDEGFSATLRREMDPIWKKILSQELTAFCRRKLAAYKVPRILGFRDLLPVSPAGKILRRELR